MNVIISLSRKQLDEPKGPHGEEDEGLVKDKGNEILEETGRFGPEK